MLRISKDGSNLLFIPPEKTKEQEFSFPLVYGHVCPKCNNLVQALFMTDRVIDPKPWEEIMTKQLDKEGHYKRIIPGRSVKWNSRYNITRIGRGSSISAELIKFTEHFDPKEDPNRLPICDFFGVSSMIPEYRLYDMLLAHLQDPSRYTITDKDYSEVKEKLMSEWMGKQLYDFVPAVGNGPEMVFISRQLQMWVLNEALRKYSKQNAPAV